jgi:hypothetical protein
MQRKTLVAALIIAAAAVAVAGFLLLRGGPEGVPEPRTTIERALEAESPPPSWEGPPPPDESGVISVTEFTEYQDASDPNWADSPARIALEFLDLGDPSGPDQGAFTTTVIQEANPEGGEQAEVTVTLEGLLDDSVQAIRYVLKFQKDADGAWRLASATWAQRCAPGRGHQDFSTELCI